MVNFYSKNAAGSLDTTTQIKINFTLDNYKIGYILEVIPNLPKTLDLLLLVIRLDFPSLVLMLLFLDNVTGVRLITFLVIGTTVVILDIATVLTGGTVGECGGTFVVTRFSISL